MVSGKRNVLGSNPVDVGIFLFFIFFLTFIGSKPRFKK